MDTVEAINLLVKNWHATRRWAEELLCSSLAISSASDVLNEPFKGTHSIPGTEWTYRTRGIGVDISKPDSKGGIDFDFDKPNPDEWRLRFFMIKQYNDGKLKKSDYRQLMQDEDIWKRSYDLAIKREGA